MRAFLNHTMMALRARFASKKGQTLVEYALVMAMVSIVMVGVFTLLDARIVTIFSAMTAILDTAQASH